MRPCLPLLTLLLTAVLPAQTVPLTHPTVLPVVESLNCPANFTARRWNHTTALQDVRDKHTGPGQHGLILHADDGTLAASISSATVVVYGSAPSARLELTAGDPSGSLRETFHLAEFARDSAGNWRLTTDHVPLIRRIEITDIHFADGTVWHVSADSQCRFQPDGFLPVAGVR